MTKTYITAVGTANPPYKISQMQTAEFMAKVLYLNELETRKLKFIYKSSAIDTRYSVLDDYNKTQNFDFYPNENSLFPSTAHRMELYKKFACPLAIEAIKDALKLKNQAILKEITHLITVSCTGMYAPGLDIEIIEQLDLNPSIQRTCINFMGCYAAFNALKSADYICRAEPEAKVLVVGLELCTLHLQKSHSDDDLLANALFADGAVAVLLESEAKIPFSLSLESFHCDLAPRGKQDMAWGIGNFGFEMRLSSYVPDLLQTKIRDLTQSLLEKTNTQLADIQHFAIHPGGRKILEVIEKSLEIPHEKNASAYEVLRNYGNMSSVTVLFVLKNLWQKLSPKNQGEKILSMAFGPGLTLESALLKIWVA